MSKPLRSFIALFAVTTLLAAACAAQGDEDGTAEETT